MSTGATEAILEKAFEQVKERVAHDANATRATLYLENELSVSQFVTMDADPTTTLSRPQAGPSLALAQPSASAVDPTQTVIASGKRPANDTVGDHPRQKKLRTSSHYPQL